MLRIAESFTAVRFLIALLAADLAFVALHFADELPFLWRPVFRIDRELSLAEIFQYSKELFCASVFAAMAIRQRYRLFWFISLLCVLLFLDDSLGLHEAAGRTLGQGLGLNDAVRAENLGQFWYGLAAAPALAVLFLLFLRGVGPEERRICTVFMAFVAGLIFAAVFVDAVPYLWPALKSWDPLLVAIEESIEHASLSGAAWWSLHNWLKRCADPDSRSVS